MYVFRTAAAELFGFTESKTLSIMEFTDKIRKKQCQNIANKMDDVALHDVTFLIGSDRIEFKANRVFLAVMSDAFQAMLFGQMQEGQRDSEVIIDDIDPSGFQSVLNYAYCKDPSITMDNVVAVKCICRKYQYRIYPHSAMSISNQILIPRISALCGLMLRPSN